MISVQSTATMQVHDELAALLAKNLTLNPGPMSVEQTSSQQQQLQQPKISYISQHYHHSSHILRPALSEQEQQQQEEQKRQQEEQQRQQEEQQQKLQEAQEIEQQLRQHGVNPASLTDVQLALFRMATPDRREYLLQLWRICQTADGSETMSLDGTAVMLEQHQPQLQQEIEKLQELEHFRRPQQPQQPQQQQPQQAQDGRWTQVPMNHYMEPYMMSGYEELARREYLASASQGPRTMDDSAIPRSKQDVPAYQTRTDPVYGNRLEISGRASWPPQHATSAEMENQYGALMAMRDSDMEL